MSVRFSTWKNELTPIILPAVTLTYSYDQLGDETSVTDSLSSQGVTSYTFDGARTPTAISTSYGGTAGPQVQYTYDEANRLTFVSRSASSGSDDTTRARKANCSPAGRWGNERVKVTHLGAI